jgi:hypothetical protein
MGLGYILGDFFTNGSGHPDFDSNVFFAPLRKNGLCAEASAAVDWIFKNLPASQGSEPVIFFIS